jgi:hypothetical protein
VIRRPKLGELLDGLRREGLYEQVAEGALRDALRAGAARHAPWFVRLLLGIGAWVAGTLFLSFLYAVDAVEDGPSGIAIGAMLVAAALALRRWAGAGDFSEQLSLAFSVAGQGLVLWGVSDLSSGEAAVAVAAMTLGLVLLALHPDRLHRFGSTVLACLSAAWLLYEWSVPGFVDGLTLVLAVATSWLWLREASLQSGRWSSWHIPVGFGVATSLFFLLLTSMPSDTDLPAAGWVSAAGLCALLLAVGWTALEEHGFDARSEPARAGAVAIVLLGLLLGRAPGILAALLVMLLAFHRRHLLLLGLATAFLIGFGSAFYYTLEMTLLAKSGILASSGALMLSVRGYLHRRFAPEAPP